MKIAIYPGTFDPITLGHLDVIEQASKIFDKVYVGILVNPGKKPMFSTDERALMIEAAAKESKLTNIEVVSSSDLTVNLAKKLSAEFMIRGLRLNTDYEYELFLHFNNQCLNPDIQTILIPPRQNLVHISSTAVRTILARNDKESLRNYLPTCVIPLVNEED